jgi:hypothetical protein
MICDTAFLIDLLRERADGRPRGAQAFLAAHRNQPFLTTVISVGEAAANGWNLGTCHGTEIDD